jgi:signal transduction histidine kinase
LAGSIATEVPVLPGGTPALDVDTMLRADPKLRGVISRDGETLRLLTRARADDLLAGRHGFGRALYTHRTIDDLMPAHTLVVAAATPLSKLARQILDRDAATRHEDMLVAWPDRRVGLVEVSTVFEHLWQGREAALSELAAQNAELAQLTSTLRETFELMTDAFFTLDRDWTFTYLNPQSEPVLRRHPSELLGKNLWRVFPGAGASTLEDELRRAMDEGVTVDFEAGYEPMNRWFSVRAYPTSEGLAVHCRDVTTRHNLEAQLLQSQKLEAVGQLAGGVAHDFNNLLTVIDGYSGLATDKVGDETFVSRALREISGASKKAAAITEKLLAFSRKQRLQTTVVDINDIVHASLSLIEPLIGEQFSIHRLLEPTAGRVRADVPHMEQVILNLAVNARDAMPEGGNLYFTTRLIPVGSAEHPALTPEPYVALSVRDEGRGMDKETLAQVFDPFFTTKPAGVGTGLGLSTSLGTVAQSGGHMAIASMLGEGTTVSIYLPRTDQLDETPTVAAEQHVSRGNGEQVLVVEDEESVRRLMVEALESAGYTVTAACNADEARRADVTRFDLVVSDVVMAGDNGVTFAREAVVEHRGLRVLFVSGYTPDSVGGLSVDGAVTAFLPKPFDTQQLAGAVYELLHR